MYFSHLVLIAVPACHAGSGGDTGKGPERDWMFMNYTVKRFEGLTEKGKLSNVTFKQTIL